MSRPLSSGSLAASSHRRRATAASARWCEPNSSTLTSHADKPGTETRTEKGQSCAD
jgi:hypothetical protein